MAAAYSVAAFALFVPATLFAADFRFRAIAMAGVESIERVERLKGNDIRDVSFNSVFEGAEEFIVRHQTGPFYPFSEVVT